LESSHFFLDLEGQSLVLALALSVEFLLTFLLSHITVGVQSTKTEQWSLYAPLCDQLNQNALLECNPSLNQVLLQLR